MKKNYNEEKILTVLGESEATWDSPDGGETK